MCAGWLPCDLLSDCSLDEGLDVLGPGLVGLLPSEAEQGSLWGGELLGYPLAPGLPACLVPGDPPADPPKVISVYLVAALPAVLTNPFLGASLLPPWLL